MGRVATAALCVVLAAGCTDDGQLDLPDDDGVSSSGGPATEDDGLTIDPSDGEDQTDPGTPVAEPSHDFPSLPAHEVDAALGPPEEDQEFFLDLYDRYYTVTQEALSAGEIDEDDLFELMSGSYRDEFAATLATRAEDGVVERFVGSVEWVLVTETASGSGVVQECRRADAASGLYGVDDGEPQELIGEDLAVVLESRFDLVADDGEDPAYRVTGTEVVEEGARDCTT